ncbi:MAG: ABC transporter permease subunit [Anaerolineae bacterium]|nr:ABC transporter permease subunit [Anaerolineae bacterium]
MWLRNLFTKTLRDLRGQILGWGIGAGLLGWMVVFLYPSFKDQTAALMEMLTGYPAALTGFFGDFTKLSTYPGWLNIELFSYGPPILAIFAVVVGTGLIAGEEEKGTLDLLLSHPIHRWRVVTEKFAAFAVATVLIMVLVALFFVSGSAMIGETRQLGRIILATMNIVPITLAGGALALMASVLFRSRRLANMVALVVIIGSYFLESLGKTVDVLEPYRSIALFHYYDSSAALFEGIKWGDASILLALTAIFFLISLFAFQRRDIAV